MWKALVLLLTIHLASGDLPPFEQAFLRGGEYVYGYESQLLTGLPLHKSKEFTGLKIRANVRLQFHQDDTVFARFEGITVHRFHGKVEDPKIQLPINAMMPVSGAEFEAFLTWLKKPIRFVYRLGKIVVIDTMPDEPAHSVNLKKGALGLIHVILEKPGEDPPTAWWEHRLYKVVEAGIAGDCEAVYDAWPFKKAEKEEAAEKDINISGKSDTDYLMYTKTKNLQECKCDLDSWEIPLALDEQGKPRQRDALMKATSIGTYIIRGTPRQFLIESVVNDGQYFVDPMITELTPVTYTKQNLFLISAGPIPFNPDFVITIPEVVEEREGGLLFEILPEFDIDKITGVVGIDTAKMGAIETLLNEIVAAIGPDFILEQAPEKFWFLVKELRHPMTEAEWRWVFNTLLKKPGVSDEILKKRRRVILDALPLVGTEEALIVAFEMIEAKEIKWEDANQVFTGLAIMAPIKPELVTKLLSLCKTEAIIEQPTVHSTCWLSLGALVNKVCVKYDKCTKETKDLVIKNLMAGIKPTKPVSEQVMCLKAIGNAGLPETVEPLITAAKNIELAVGSRCQAMQSMRKFRKDKVLAEKVRVALLPMFVDVELDPELRIDAFGILMLGPPTFPFYELIAKHTHVEPNAQVGAYVHSYLWSRSRLRHPLYRKKAELATLALKLVKPWPFAAIHMSKALDVEMKLPTDKLAVMTKMDMIGHPSLIPRSAAAKMNIIMLNKVFEAVEIGFRQEGLLPFLTKTLPIGPKPITAPKKSATFDSVEGIEGIAHSLRLKAKKPEKPNLMLYMKVLGHELRMLNIDEGIFKKLITLLGGLEEIEDTLREPKKIHLQKAIALGENIRKAVTEVGIPITINVTASAVVSAELEGALKIDPKLFTEKSLFKVRTVEGSLKTTPVVAAYMSTFMGADATIVKVGIGLEAVVKATSPFETKLVVDVPEKKLQSFETVPGKEIRMVQVKVHPHTLSVVGKEPTTRPTPFSPAEGAPKIAKTIETALPKHEIVRRLHTTPVNEILKLDVDVEATCSQMGTGLLPWMCDPLAGPMTFIMTVKPKSPVEVVKFQMDMSLASTPRSGFVGNNWRLHEVECLSGDRLLHAVQVAVIRTDKPEAKLVDALIHLDIQDGRYNSFDTALAVKPFFEIVPYKLCMQGEMVIPNTILDEGAVALHDKEVKGWLRMQTGQACDKNNIDVEMTISKTADQIIDELDKVTIEDELCEKDKILGKPYSLVCRKLALLRSHLNKILVEVKSAKITEKEFLAAWPRIMTNVKHFLWAFRYPSFVDYLDHYVKRFALEKPEEVWWWWWLDGVTVPAPGKLVFLLEVDKVLRGFDATIKTPVSWDMFRVKDLPIELPTMSAKESMVNHIKKIAMMQEIAPTCKVMGTELNTFDLVKLEHTFGECDHVIAMDGTADETFAVTAAIKPGTTQKIVTVFLENKKIELVPGSRVGEGLLVKIDGEIKELVTNQRMFVRFDNKEVVESLIACAPEKLKSDPSPILFEIRHYLGALELVAEHLGLRVKSDGASFKVEVSPLMRGKVVGLCGNFDGEVYNDNIAAHGVPVPTWTKFIRTWQLTPEWCQANRILI